ncbi:MAG: radical SAM protein [Candidatus Omnitrophica bacterium]|nr:radical SAM protein [Candidatus Omnitrophota bacterium]
MASPPLGLLYVATYLKHSTQHQVKVIDLQLRSARSLKIESVIHQFKPDVVGMYTTSFTLFDVYCIAESIKRYAPSAHISLGGPHVNIYPEETLSSPAIDSIILGHGEIPFTQLVSLLEKKADLYPVRGLLYKENGTIIKTQPPDEGYDLDSLPFPDRTLLPISEYYNVLSEDSPSTTMISSLGCPYQCMFCYNPPSNRKVRFRRSDHIVEEMKQCSRLGIKEIFFVDEVFLLDQSRAEDICNRIIAQGLNLRWGIRTRVDTVKSFDVLKRLKQAGCKRIQLGVEAGTERTLEVLKKRFSLTQVERAFEKVKRAGLETVAYFMIGSPEEQRADILSTIDLAIRLDPDYAHFSITTPFPGTELYELGLKEKIYEKDFWKEFALCPRPNFSPHLWDKHISEKEIEEMFKYAYRRFYMRPDFIVRNIFKHMGQPGLLRNFMRKIEMGWALFNYLYH